jgi:hypothetical protein|tara:strand:- start:429 stop:1148 length:720 start_codon:yes stop_codon:yes gene_type:complete
MTKGYIYVASLRKDYYIAAKKSAESLKDFYPEANVTLFTHADWVELDDYKLFDQIRTHDGLGNDMPMNNRAKLWALSTSPYDVTMYLDCDTMIEHEDIRYAFDHLKDNDVIFTLNRPYNAKITKLNDDESMKYHCGIFVYRKNKATTKLMDDWYKYYLIQSAPMHDVSPYPESVKPWDTFTMWYLLNKTAHKDTVTVGEFGSPDARWNFVVGQKPEELDGTEVIIRHYLLNRHIDKWKH